MNEVLFESQTTYSKNILKEYHLAYIFKTKYWMIFLLPLILLVFGIIKNNWVFWAGILFELLLVLIVFLQFCTAAKIAYIRACEQNDGQDLTNILQFCEEKIYIENPLTGNKFAYNYSKVKRIAQTKNLVLIVTKAKVLLCVEKSKFSVGSAEELVVFLKFKIKQQL